MGVRETAVWRTDSRFLTAAIECVMILLTDMLRIWGENIGKWQ